MSRTWGKWRENAPFWYFSFLIGIRQKDALLRLEMFQHSNIINNLFLTPLAPDDAPKIAEWSVDSLKSADQLSTGPRWLWEPPETKNEFGVDLEHAKSISPIGHLSMVQVHRITCWFPEIGVPSNHPFSRDFPWNAPTFLDTSFMETAQIAMARCWNVGIARCHAVCLQHGEWSGDGHRVDDALQGARFGRLPGWIHHHSSRLSVENPTKMLVKKGLKKSVFSFWVVLW